MSKSILIIDTPEDCLACPCFSVIGSEHCSVTMKEVGLHIPKWCPLKPMPKKKPFATRGRQNGFSMVDVIKNTEWMGWNECIDEILGETE